MYFICCAHNKRSAPFCCAPSSGREAASSSEGLVRICGCAGRYPTMPRPQQIPPSSPRSPRSGLWCDAVNQSGETIQPGGGRAVFWFLHQLFLLFWQDQLPDLVRGGRCKQLCWHKWRRGSKQGDGLWGSEMITFLKMELYLTLGWGIRGEEGVAQGRSRGEAGGGNVSLRRSRCSSLAVVWPHSSLRMENSCSQFCWAADFLFIACVWELPCLLILHVRKKLQNALMVIRQMFRSREPDSWGMTFLVFVLK